MVGRGLLAELPRTLVERCPARPYAVISDSRVAELYGSRVLGLMRDAGLEARLFPFPNGEWNKTRETWAELTDAMLKARVGRDGAVVALGGGVTGDLAGFVAATFLRGVPYVQVPTTLLAMIDASVGGKTGVDFAGLKNLVGTFYPASRITVTPPVLAKLPPREYLSGIAEVVKTAMIGDPGLMEVLRSRREAVMARDAGLVEEIVRRCLAVKGGIVEEDPREQGRRAVLNLGHTFAHALESCSGFSGWSHGEAVAWGTGRAVRAGLLLGETDPGYAEQTVSLLGAYGFRLEARAEPTDLLQAMRMDKKRRGGAIRLVIPRGPGDVVIRDGEDDLILRTLTG